MRNERLRMLIVTALFAAIIAVLAQVSIPLPFSPVPITGQTLAIGLAATILGSRYGTLSVIVYLLLGAVGAPVFAGMEGGLGALVGPTGGYLIGFVPTAFVIGWYVEKFGFTVTHAIVANIIGMVITLAFGTAWLKVAAEMSWSVAIAAGVTPFLLLGVVKAVLAAVVGIAVRKRLASAKLMPTTV
ncbi:biotin transporter BioY [Paenisporosarcina cavernae]|uniref:Biotin transporter n=1 Tax=Paenisporosarcina cavernae TaxID=2320858 RepID=A0A385YT64_9BACL|nr:biotin transporter BioY [Paenisporosarcina cavernae]AYC28878.1 biotin transporter BioY [Paenisporosarcina cavernae]